MREAILADVPESDAPSLSSDGGQMPKIRIGDLLARIGDCFCELDSEFRVTYINVQAATLWGGAQADFVGKRLLDVVALPVGGETLGHLIRAMVDRAPHHFEIFSPVVKRWIEFSIHPCGDGLAVFIRDIHARKVAEIALLASEERFRHLADLVPNIVWTANAYGEIDYNNLRWHRYTGLSRSGTGDWTWLDAVHPEDKGRIAMSYEAAMRKSVASEDELRLRGANGVYRWHLGRMVPIKDDSGAVIQWVGALTDISAQKSAEVAIRLRAAHLEEAQQLTGIGSWEINVAAGTRIWSREHFRLFDIEPAESAPDNESVLALFHPDDSPALAEAIVESARDGTGYDLELRGAPQRDKPVRWFHATGRCVRGPDGAIARRFGTVMDITERKRSDAQRLQLLEEVASRAAQHAESDAG